MPKKTKSIPTDRALWTFGDAVWWHFFIHGTRPNGRRRVWAPLEATHELGLLSVRTLWNWVDNDPPPYDATTLARVLFGNSDEFDDWREELRRLLVEERAKPKTAQPTPAGRAVVLYAVDYPDKDDSDVIDAEFEVIPAGGSENIGNDHAQGTNRADGGPRTGRALDPKPPIVFPAKPKRQSRRYGIPVFVGGVAALFIIAAVSQVSRNATPPATTATIAPTAPPLAETPSRRDPPLAQPAPAPAAAPAAPPPTPAPMPLPTVAAPDPSPVKPEAKPAAPLKPVDSAALPPATTPSPDEEMVRKTIEALKAGQDAERIAREKQAIQRDKEELAAAQAITNREKYTGDIAGMGYTVKENQSISAGRSLGPMATATVAECALSCLGKDCDGFAFFGAHPPSQISNLKPCYRYKKPLTFFPNSGYTSGERIADLAALSQARPATAAGPTTSTDPERVAQPGSQPSSPSLPSDGLTRCANGPVKVTGFTLTCDKLLTGGTALGSTQLAYAVNDINECAAKCRPAQSCTGFTFNSAEPPGKRSCQIFGGRPGMNNGNGWISGTR
jgi:hypothetical protein